MASDEVLGGSLPRREAVSRQQRRLEHSKMKAEKTGCRPARERHLRPVSFTETDVLAGGSGRGGSQASVSRLHSHADGRHAGEGGK